MTLDDLLRGLIWYQGGLACRCLCCFELYDSAARVDTEPLCSDCIQNERDAGLRK